MSIRLGGFCPASLCIPQPSQTGPLARWDGHLGRPGRREDDCASGLRTPGGEDSEPYRPVGLAGLARQDASDRVAVTEAVALSR